MKTFKEHLKEAKMTTVRFEIINYHDKKTVSNMLEKLGFDYDINNAEGSGVTFEVEVDDMKDFEDIIRPDLHKLHIKFNSYV